MSNHRFGKAVLALVGAATLLPAAPALAAWQLNGTTTSTVFVPDVYQGRKLANSSVAYRYVPAAAQRFDGAKQLVGKTPREVRTDLKNPSKELLSGGIYSVYKLVRSDKWNDAQYQTPWTLYNMKQKQAQTTNFFVFEWRDQISGAIIRDNDPNFEVGAWGDTGSPEKDTVAGTGADLWDYLVKEDFRTENQEVMLAKVPVALASSEAAKAKSATFLSDSGSGGSVTSVAGSQKRTAFKADEAVVSNAKEPASAGTSGRDVNLPGSSNVTSLPTATPAPVVVNPIPAQSPTPVVVKPTPTPAPVVVTNNDKDKDKDKDKGFSMEDWVGAWKSKGQSGNAYDYQVVVQKFSNKNIKYSFDSWFRADAFDNLPPTEFSTNGAFADDKKTAYLDSEGTVNCNLKLIRENGQLRMTGTVTMRQIDWWGRVGKTKTYSVVLTK
ncbi:MAG TPA: hypothetical protein V6D00_06390 [Pantanalinema sp.]